MTPARWISLLVLLAAALFALQGGEYSTTALRALKGDERDETARIIVLRREIDSLARLAKLVETDPVTQETIAREKHGMLKPGEHAFILETSENKPQP